MLSKVVRPDGDEVTFTYDALARRLSKTFRGRTTRWIWDGNVPLHEWVEQAPAAESAPVPGDEASLDELAARRLRAELAARPAQGPPAHAENEGTATSPISWLFDPESFAPMAKLVGDDRYAIVTDHLGTPRAMFDQAGRQVWSATIDAYGDLKDVEGDRQACPFRWPGQYEDAETGLYYNRFRYYDCEGGGYIAQDPIGLGGGRRLLGYARDPIRLIDPLGLSCTDNRVGPKSHLEQFREGGSLVMSRDAYFKRVHGAPTVGRPDGLFITTKGKMDQILAEAGGDLSKIEQKLGFDPGYFSNGNGLVRVDIADPLAHNARMPSGFEAGANEHFVWGGYTSGGVPEAVVNPVPVSQTTVTFL